MIERVLDHVCSWVASKLPLERHRLITRGDNSPYLMRFYLLRHPLPWLQWNRRTASWMRFT